MGLDLGRSNLGRETSAVRGAAQVYSVPSAVTGAILEYVSPLPIADLLAGVDQPPLSGAADERRQLNTICSLLYVLGHRSSRGLMDERQAQMSADVVCGRITVADLAACIRLANSIDPRVRALREEIVFCGGSSASAASHVYAPHGEIAARIEELLLFLSCPARNRDAFTVALVVGYFCSTLHPFRDANGRWARLVSLYAACRSGRPDLGMRAVAFMCVMNDYISGILWPGAIHNGLGGYLQVAKKFDDLLAAKLESEGILDEIDRDVSALSSSIKSAGVLRRVVSTGLALGPLNSASLSEAASMSRTSAERALNHMRNICEMDDIEAAVKVRNEKVWAAAICTKNEILEELNDG